MPLEIEEDFDPISLGFDFGLDSTTHPDEDSLGRIHQSEDADAAGPPSQQSDIKRHGETAVSKVPRPINGRYASADWVPPAKGVVEALTANDGSDIEPPGKVEPACLGDRKHTRIGESVQDAVAAPAESSDRRSVDDVEADTPVLKPRVQVRLVRTRLPSGHKQRIAIRVSRPRIEETSVSIVPINDTDSPSSPSASSQPSLNYPPEARPFVKAFGGEAYERIESQSKTNATTGNALPNSVRDLFPSLSDLQSAIQLSNSVRRTQGLSEITITKSNRIPLLRTVAQTREELYKFLLLSLTLPKAPISTADESEEEGESEESVTPAITLTPDNLKILLKALPKAFPHQKGSIKSFLADDRHLAYGEMGGKVVWQGGIGRVVGAEGGFRGKGLQDGDVHVFLDHSNILYGLITALYSDTSDSLPPKHLRTLSLPALSVLLRRGRITPPGTLHAVASSPLKQDLDPLVRLGWEVSVLKRVEIMEDEVEDPIALKLTSKSMDRIPSGEGTGTGLRRYKEQAVDELLHLKLLQALNTKEREGRSGRGCTIVLATGDARGGQFNRDGFVGAVKEALRREWTVELWSFRAGLSRAWYDVARRERWFDGHRFSIHHLDDWSEQLVEVTDNG